MKRHGRRSKLALLCLLVAVTLAWLGPLLIFALPALAAPGNDVGRNLGSLLRGYATQVYGGIIAIVSLIFLLNRRYTDLAVFLLAAVMVAWMVFSPDQVAQAARGIGRQILS